MNNIPIVILSRDRLTPLERLVDQLLLLGYDNLHILDIASTYKPLIEYYKTCPAEVIYADNCGHKGLWTAGYIDRFANYPWVAVTDSDIELNINTPNNFIEQLIIVAKDFRFDKVGLAIEYKDITNQYLKQIITPIEEQYWKRKLQHKLECYLAPVDTTFCIVNPTKQFTYQAIRVAGDHTCKHLDWYSDWSNLSEEELYYISHCDPTIATTVQHYQQYLFHV